MFLLAGNQKIDSMSYENVVSVDPDGNAQLTILVNYEGYCIVKAELIKFVQIF